MLEKFVKKNVITILFSAAAAFILGGFIWAAIALRAAGNQPLILHFDDIHGITSVGSFGVFIFIAVLGLLVVLMNFFIAREFESRSWFLGKFLAALTFLFGFLLFISFAAIINANV